MRPGCCSHERCGNTSLVVVVVASIALLTLGTRVAFGRSGNSSRALANEDEEFPYLVSIHEETEVGGEPVLVHICNGAIKSERYILTVAHCFNGVRINTPNLVAKVGCRSVTRCKRSYDVDRVILHPKYKSSLADGSNINDLAMVVLKKSIDFGKLKNVAPIAIYDKVTDKGCKPNMIAGIPDGDKRAPERGDVFQYSTTILDDKDCSKIHTSSSDKIICVKSGGEPFPKNFSGSLLVARGQKQNCASKKDLLFGLVSYTRDENAVATRLRTTYEELLSEVNKIFPPNGTPSPNPPPRYSTTTRAPPDEPGTTSGPPSNAYTTSGPPSDPYTTPGPPGDPYTTPGPPSNTYTTPEPPSNPYTTPGPPSDPYTTPGPPSNPYTTPGPPSNTYTTPGPPSYPWTTHSPPGYPQPIGCPAPPPCPKCPQCPNCPTCQRPPVCTPGVSLCPICPTCPTCPACPSCPECPGGGPAQCPPRCPQECPQCPIQCPGYCPVCPAYPPCPTRAPCKVCPTERPRPGQDPRPSRDWWWWPFVCWWGWWL